MLKKDTFQFRLQDRIINNYKEILDNLEKSLHILEQGLVEAAEMRKICTDEWCAATEHVIDELSNSLFSISEPSWSTDEQSRKLKGLKKRLHDLYSQYKSVSAK